jgi:hypothetical protein
VTLTVPRLERSGGEPNPVLSRSFKTAVTPAIARGLLTVTSFAIPQKSSTSSREKSGVF